MLAVIVHLLHLPPSFFNIQKVKILTTAGFEIASHQITFLIISSASIWKSLSSQPVFKKKRDETRRDETRRDETRRDETRRREEKRREEKRDETRRERRDETRKRREREEKRREEKEEKRR
ncbi:hypothetical protein DUI87_17972 [Hirundo rustica rustica]|uniref:Uncharacterized protein n=1 Tax=Hirundo rustica rustica TaxID=333673 RepID=A0A3M0K0Q2_HIRRU|nr:hypothetical protein DUI87_17972 [Hirundo rustica rustica]